MSDLRMLVANPFADLVESIISDRFKNIAVIKSINESRPEEDISKVDVIVSWFPVAGLIPLIENLKWFQVMSAGYEHVLSTGLIKSPVLLTHAGGVAAEAVAEMVMAFMLGLVKRFPESFSNKERHIFPGVPGEAGLPTDDLSGKIVGVLGAGYIGKSIAKKARALDMSVLGYDKFVKKADNFERIYSDGDLDEVLSRSDFVVIALPLIEETRDLIAERELRLMKSDAYLINVARGELLNKQSFVRALKEDWIAGGAIDVVWADDPAHMVLKPEDELWKIPNLIITPHNAAFTPRYIPRFCELLCRNIDKFVSGEPLLNVVPLD